VSDKFGMSYSTASRLIGVGAARNGKKRAGGRTPSHDRKQAIISYLIGYIKSYGWAPSQREIAEAVGASLNAVNIDLEILKEQGLIEMGPQARQIRVVGTSMKTPEVTL
jgi:SOS-response transcriptional repressor LexA